MGDLSEFLWERVGVEWNSPMTTTRRNPTNSYYTIYHTISSDVINSDAEFQYNPGETGCRSVWMYQSIPCCVHKQQIPEASRCLLGGPCAPCARSAGSACFSVPMRQRCCPGYRLKPRRPTQSAQWCLGEKERGEMFTIQRPSTDLGAIMSFDLHYISSCSHKIPACAVHRQCRESVIIIYNKYNMLFCKT